MGHTWRCLNIFNKAHLFFVHIKSLKHLLCTKKLEFFSLWSHFWNFVRNFFPFDLKWSYRKRGSCDYINFSSCLLTLCGNFDNFYYFWDPKYIRFFWLTSTNPGPLIFSFWDRFFDLVSQKNMTETRKFSFKLPKNPKKRRWYLKEMPRDLQKLSFFWQNGL